MLKYIIKRLLYGVLVMLGVTVSVFFLFHALPGDPVSMMVGQRTDKVTRENITKELGLDLPLHQQLLKYLNDVSPVSVHENTAETKEKYEYTKLISGEENTLVLKTPYLRRSFHTQKLVTEIIIEYLEGTLVLAITAMIFASFFGIFFGTISALKHGSATDGGIIASTVLGISFPSFVSAILISMVFGYYLADYTGLNVTGTLYETDAIRGKHLELKNLILPALTLGIRPLAIITQLTRSSMLEVLNQDYIRTAKAKGVGRFALVFKHALKNALNPVVTAVSGWLATLMAGAVFVETIFSWKGIGLITINSVQTLDFPVVMGTTIFMALSFVIINILVDIVYALLDPRVKLN